MNSETLFVLLQMFKTASNDQTRIHLNGVFVQKVNYGESAKLLVMACDGHIAAQKIIHDEGLCSLLKTGDKLFVFPEQAKAIKAMMGKSHGVDCALTDSGNVAFSLGGQTVNVERNSELAGRFPVDQVKGFFSPKMMAPISVAFNAEYLLDLVESLKNDKRSLPTVVLTFDAHSIGSAIKVSPLSPDSETAGVLMPVRGDNSLQLTNNATLAMGVGKSETNEGEGA